MFYIKKRVFLMGNRELDALLEKIGLTEYESKTLSTLFRMGEAEAPAISRLAQVPKTRVYDVLDKLVEKNLVIEIKGRPKRYRGIDAKKALETLLLSRKSELQELESGIANLGTMLSDSQKEEPGETVMKVKDKHDFERILAQEISKAKTSIVGFSEVTDKEHTLREAIELAKGKKVDMRLINSYPNDWLGKASEMRQLEHGLNAFIVDGKRVILALSDFKQEKPDYHFTIFHDHKPMANAFQHYFDKCWAVAKK